MKFIVMCLLQCVCSGKVYWFKCVDSFLQAAYNMWPWETLIKKLKHHFSKWTYLPGITSLHFHTKKDELDKIVDFAIFRKYLDPTLSFRVKTGIRCDILQQFGLEKFRFDFHRNFSKKNSRNYRSTHFGNFK